MKHAIVAFRQELLGCAQLGVQAAVSLLQAGADGSHIQESHSSLMKQMTEEELKAEFTVEFKGSSRPRAHCRQQAGHKVLQFTSDNSRHEQAADLTSPQTAGT